MRAFYATDDDMKELKPYFPQETETGPPGSEEGQRYTLALGGVQTTQSVFGDRLAGLERGQLESVIGSLVRLASAYPEDHGQGQEGKHAS